MTDVPAGLLLTVDQDIEIAAPPDGVFDALLKQLGERFGPPGGEAMSMQLEPWPGGRWYRDLGNNEGHLWGHVQVMKRPTLLEIVGPLFMSYPAISHMQMRLSASGEGTRLALRHQALGMIQDDHRQGVGPGWAHFLEGVRNHAER